MLSLTLIALIAVQGAAIGSASRFSVVTFPQCSRSCVTAQAEHVGCDATDLGCICDPLNDFYDLSLTDCLEGECSTSDNIRFDNQWSDACEDLLLATDSFLNPDATSATIPSISYPTGTALLLSSSSSFSDSDFTDTFPTDTLDIPTPTFTLPSFSGSDGGGGGGGDDGDSGDQSSSSSSSSSRRRRGRRLSPGAIAGIVIGVLAGVSGALASLLLWIRKHRANAAAAAGESEGNGDGAVAAAANVDNTSDDNTEFAKPAESAIVTIQEDTGHNNNTAWAETGTDMQTTSPEGIPRRPIIVYERVNGEERIHQFSQSLLYPNANANADPSPSPSPSPNSNSTPTPASFNSNASPDANTKISPYSTYGLGAQQEARETTVSELAAAYSQAQAQAQAQTQTQHVHVSSETATHVPPNSQA